MSCVWPGGVMVTVLDLRHVNNVVYFHRSTVVNIHYNQNARGNADNKARYGILP